MGVSASLWICGLIPCCMCGGTVERSFYASGWQGELRWPSGYSWGVRFWKNGVAENKATKESIELSAKLSPNLI